MPCPACQALPSIAPCCLAVAGGPAASGDSTKVASPVFGAETCRIQSPGPLACIPCHSKINRTGNVFKRLVGHFVCDPLTPVSTLRLDEVLNRLYDSEINFSLIAEW